MIRSFALLIAVSALTGCAAKVTMPPLTLHHPANPNGESSKPPSHSETLKVLEPVMPSSEQVRHHTGMGHNHGKHEEGVGDDPGSEHHGHH